MKLKGLPGSLDEVCWDIDGPEETARLAGEFIAAGFNPLKVLQSLAFQLADTPEAAQRIAKIIGIDKATVEWLQAGYMAEMKLYQLIDDLSDFYVVDFPENLEPFAATVRAALGTLQEIAATVECLEHGHKAMCAVLDKLDSDFLPQKRRAEYIEKWQAPNAGSSLLAKDLEKKGDES